MKISAVLACHNEQDFIQAWMEETCCYADEILIAVHAPTDRTAEIISEFRNHAPIPIRSEWFPAKTVMRFGFSVMKNEMIARASGDWVTSIDADEEIGMSRDELHAVIEKAQEENCRAISLRWAQLPETEIPKTEIPESNLTMADRLALRTQHIPIEPEIRKCKIFRNHQGCWWHGLIHEELRIHDTPAAVFCFQADALLHHYGYLGGASPEWKQALYSYLICRIRDRPFQRAGTHPWWYEDGFVVNEAGIRESARQFERNADKWFPELPARKV